METTLNGRDVSALQPEAAWPLICFVFTYCSKYDALPAAGGNRPDAARGRRKDPQRSLISSNASVVPSSAPLCAVRQKFYCTVYFLSRTQLPSYSWTFDITIPSY
jgi:hypothetical protein